MNENYVLGSELPASHLRLLQIVFDLFKSAHEWPLSRMVQVAYEPGDFWIQIDLIDHHLVRHRGQKMQRDSRTILSIEGIALCQGSEGYVQLFLRALKICVETYSQNPEHPVVTREQIRNRLELDEAHARLTMELLFGAERVWVNAPQPEGQGITQIELDPDVRSYRDVSYIVDYLKIVRARRPNTTDLVPPKLLSLEEISVILKSFSTLHYSIRERCWELFSNEHYLEAVEASFKVVRDRLRELTGFERGQDAFGKGKLHIDGSAAPNVDDDFNQGVKYLLMAIGYFRNEKSHTSKENSMEPIRAYEYLRLSSLAMSFLDRATATELSHNTAASPQEPESGK